MKRAPLLLQFPAVKSAALAMSFLFSVAVFQARAVDRTWDGGGDTGLWGNNINWAGDVTPAAGDSLSFTLTTRLNNTNDLAAGTLFNGVTFSTPAGAFNLRGNQITLGGGITNEQVVTLQTITLPLSLSATRPVSVVDGGSLALGGVISGAGGLSKFGGGELTLSGANTFAGPVTVNAGQVTVSSDANLGTAPASPTPASLVLDGGTLHVTADFTLDANRGIAVGDAGGGEGRIDTDNGASLVYGGIVAGNGGAGGLTKGKFGDITLSGANTYTGPTAIKVGTINLDFTTGGTADIINSGSTLQLGGENADLGGQSFAAIVMNGAAGETDTQTFNGTSLDIGTSRIVANSGSGGSATLNLGALTHAPGGNVTIRLPANGAINTTSPNVNGILGGFAMVSDGSIDNGILAGIDYATVDGSGKISAYANYTIWSGSGTIADVAGPSVNFKIDSSTTGDLTLAPPDTGVIDLNTLNLDQGSGRGNPNEFSIIVNPNNTLRMGAFGGISRSDNLNVSSQGGDLTWVLGDSVGGANGVQDEGTLTAGGADNTPGEIVFTINNRNQSSGSLNVEVKITDNGTAPVRVVKSGRGSMKFRGHNTYSGGTYIMQGRFQLAGSEIGTGNPDGWGTGPVYIFPGAQAFPSGIGGGNPFTNQMFLAGFGTDQENTGAIRLGNGSEFSGPITLFGDAELGGGGNGNAASGGAIISGAITGDFGLDIGSRANVGGGASVVILSNTNNAWTGNTRVVGRTGGTSGNGRLVLGNDNVIPDGFGFGGMIVGLSGVSSSTCTLDLNGHNETINGLSSAGNEANDFIENNGTTTATLTVGNNNQSGTFGGTIRDGTGLANTLGGGGFGSLALTKIGGGVLTLTGNNSYTGPTTVEGGRLSVSGAGAIASAETILDGGILDVSDLTSGFFAPTTVRMNNGTLVAGRVGVTASSLNTTNSGLTVTLDQTAINFQTTTLATGGATNFINIDSVLNISGYPAQFTVIKYSGTVGGAGANFGLGTVPSTATTGFVSNDVANARIVVVLLNGPKPLTWVGNHGPDWDVGLTENWLAFKGTVNEAASTFSTADFAVFDNTGLTNRVNLTEVLSPGGVTLDDTIDYTFYGPGTISGFGGLTKNGSGTLFIANDGVNDFSGRVTINSGTLQVGTNGSGGNLPSVPVVNNGSLVFSRSNSLTEKLTISGSGSLTQNGSGTTTLTGASTYEGLTTVAQGTLRAGSGAAFGTPDISLTDPGIVISNGATLDVGGQNLTAEAVTVSGAGAGGNGAIINSGAEQQNALLTVTLTGDTTFGGSGRWDIRGTGATLSTLSTPQNLTKVGANQVSLVGVDVDPLLGNINVQQGTLSVETTTATLGDSTKTLTVASGATLQFFNTTTPFDKNFVLNGNGTSNTINAASGADNAISGAVSLNGNCIVNNGGSDDNLTLSGTVGGGGSLTKTGGSELRLTGTASYSGFTAINGGTLVLTTTISGGGTLSNAVGATISGSGTNSGPALISGNLLPGGPNAVGNFGTGPLTLNAAHITFDIGKPDNLSVLNSDHVFANGSLTATGVTTLTLEPGTAGALTNGQIITLIQYSGGSAPSSNSFALAAVPPGFAFSLVDPATTPNAIQVRVDAAPASLKWTGTDLSNPSRWDLQITTNWVQTGSGLPAAFRNLDAVTFDDSGVTRTVSLAGDLQPSTVSVANGFAADYTFSGDGSLSGPGSLNVGASGGTLIIANSGSNGFTGPITVSGGTLQVGDGSTNGNLGSGVLTNNGALVFDRSDALLVNNTISGAGTITNLGAGVTTLGSGNPAFDGSIVVSSGTLRAGNAAALGTANGTTAVKNGATLDVNGQNLTTEPVTVSGAGVGNEGAIVNSGAQQLNALLTVTLAGNTTFGGTGRWDIRGTGASLTTQDPLTFGPAPFNLTKVGPNQISLVGVTVDAALADINVQEGILGVETTTTSLGEPTNTLTVASGATLQFYNTASPWDKVFVLNGSGTNNTVNAASGPDNTIVGVVTLNGACIFNNGGSDDNLTLSGVVSGSGSLTKTGGSALTLSSADTYIGATTVSGGTLVLLNNGAIVGSSTITVAAGATLDASARVDGTLTLLSGQTLQGSGTVLGTVIAGAGSTVAPGTSVGQLSVGNISLGGTTAMEVDASNHTNDVLRAITGSVNYGGTLVITNIGPVTGSNTFQLFSGTLSGTFANIITPTISGVTWDTSKLTVDGTVTVVGPGVSTTPTSLTFVASGNTLDISWPQDHTGWRLEGQTNSLSVGLSTNWVTIPGSTTTNRMIIPIGTGNDTVFYRLVYP